MTGYESCFTGEESAVAKILFFFQRRGDTYGSMEICAVGDLDPVTYSKMVGLRRFRSDFCECAIPKDPEVITELVESVNEELSAWNYWDGHGLQVRIEDWRDTGYDLFWEVVLVAEAESEEGIGK